MLHLNAQADDVRVTSGAVRPQPPIGLDTDSLHRWILFGHASGTFEGLPSMEVPGVNAFIGDTFANPEGSELCSGFFELKAGQPLEYTYTYDEMKVVVEGEFHLTD